MKRRLAVVGLGFFIALGGACVGDSSTGDGGGPDVTTSDVKPQPEAGNDVASDAAPSDASTAACNLAKPFDPPQPLTNVTTSAYHEDGIWLMPDLLNAYVSAQRADSGKFDIFTTSRSAVDASFGSLVPLPGPVNTSLDERIPIVAADNLSLYYYTTANNGMYTAARANVQTAFGAGQPVATPLASSTPYEGVSWISNDGLTIYIASARGDGVHAHIMVATRTSAGVPFGTPTSTGMPNSTSGDENGAVLTADQLTIYFLSTQNGNPDIWKATRSTTADGFGAPTVVPELNGTSFNQPAWVSPDGCTIYVVHKPADAGNTYDLLVASKPAT